MRGHHPTPARRRWTAFLELYSIAAEVPEARVHELGDTQSRVVPLDAYEKEGV
jgi:hypothetical protein